MTFSLPYLLKPEESGASQHLFQICFIDESLADTLPDPAAEARPMGGEVYGIRADDGRLVSQISVHFMQLNICGLPVKFGSIGGVATHPHYRGHGLATRLLDVVSRRIVEAGARAMIISGARGLYRRAGSELMGKFAGFKLRPGDFPAPAAGVTVRPATPADAAWCARLYRMEPVHFDRPVTRYIERFQPHRLSYHAEDLVIEVDGSPAAYLLLTIPWDNLDRGESDAGVRGTYEYAGSRAALASAIPVLMEQLRLNELQAQFTWQDVDLLRLLGAAKEPEWEGLEDHTIRLLDLPGLMSDLRPYLQSILTPEQLDGLRFEQTGPLIAGISDEVSRLTILRGEDRLELDGSAMTRLIFGDPTPTPLSIPGPLGDLTRALFPLPAFFTGLDYH